MSLSAPNAPVAPSPPVLQAPFRIGAIHVHPSLHQLRRGDHIEKVEPRLMQVLCLLATHPGEVVTRETLLTVVWAEGYAQDEVLTQTISRLRRALGDQARDAHIIETIPKAGYRLIAPVHLEADEASSAPAVARRQRRFSRSALAGLGLVVVIIVLFLWPGADPAPVVTPQSIPLTTFRGQERDPAIAPDGQRIAFSWDQGARHSSGIFVKQLGSTQPLQLTNPKGQDRHPAWSPDGRFVAFTRHEGQRRSLYVIPAIGGTERLVSQRQTDLHSDLAWSPNGKWIVLADRSRPEAPSGLVLIADDGTGERQLTTPPAGTIGDRYPVFSSDGKRLAFSRTTVAGVADIYLLDLPGGTPRRITNWERVIIGLGWSRDGDHLLAASLLDGGYRLVRLPLDGGRPEVIFAGSEQLFEAAIDAAHGQLVYVASDIEVNIWTHTQGEASDVPRVTSTTWDSHPRLSPDGQHLAFASAREVAPEIWVSEADGRNPRRLTRFDGPYVGSPAWSPDGRSLVFDVREDGQADLYTVSSEGGPVRRLTHTPHDEMEPSWSRDGKQIYFASNADGRWQVQALHLTEGTIAPVTRHGGYIAQESADGTALYFTRPGEDGLWQKRLPNGPETQVLAYPSADHWGAWDLTAEGILALRAEADTQFVAFDPATGAEEEWAASSAFIPSNQRVMSVTPNGQMLFYSRVERLESDLKQIIWPRPL